MYTSSESLKIVQYILQCMYDSWVSLLVLMEFQNVWCICNMLIHNKDATCTTCDLIKVDLILKITLFLKRDQVAEVHIFYYYALKIKIKIMW